MNIYEAKASLDERLSKIASKALELGVEARFETRFENMDLIPCEGGDKLCSFLSGEAMIFPADANEGERLVFGVSLEIKCGKVDKEYFEDDIKFAEESADAFFEELSMTDDKDAFIKARISEEAALAKATFDEIEAQVKSARRVSIIAAAIGVSVLLIAGILIILL